MHERKKKKKKKEKEETKWETIFAPSSLSLQFSLPARPQGRSRWKKRGPERSDSGVLSERWTPVHLSSEQEQQQQQLFSLGGFRTARKEDAEELPGKMMQLNKHENCAGLARRGQTRRQKVHNENGFKGPFRQQPAIAEAFFGETPLGKKGKYPIRAR